MKKVKKEICCVAGCERIVKAKVHQLCNAHLVRFYRDGDVGTDKIRKWRKVRPYLKNVK